jgi:hypothetical protein
VIQGTFGVIQGTFGVIQGTFGVIQGTFGVIQGTLGVIQGTFDGSATSHRHNYTLNITHCFRVARQVVRQVDSNSKFKIQNYSTLFTNWCFRVLSNCFSCAV